MLVLLIKAIKCDCVSFYSLPFQLGGAAEYACLGRDEKLIEGLSPCLLGTVQLDWVWDGCLK